MRWAMALLYTIAGILHFAATDSFLAIVPDWVPAPRSRSGHRNLRNSGRAALLGPRWRGIAGIMLALYALCVFPANIKHAFEGIQVAGLPASWWYHAPRLALQPVIVWWALFSSESIDWPFAKPARHEGQGRPDFS